MKVSRGLAAHSEGDISQHDRMNIFSKGRYKFLGIFLVGDNSHQ
jgi:hypothetical protein